MGWILSLLVGLSLGFLGGGGSILTVPLLVYVFGFSATRATGLSLFIVGITSALGAAVYARRGDLEGKAALEFGIPATVSALLVRTALVPLLPATILGLAKDRALLVVFAMLMAFVSVRMIRPTKLPDHAANPIVLGAVVGLIAGVLGAGGGFLIVPALLLMGELPMKKAVGTSLAIIAGQSLIAFAGEVLRQPVADWRFLVSITLVSAVGLAIGLELTKHVKAQSMKPAFGWFIALVATGIDFGTKKTAYEKARSDMDAARTLDRYGELPGLLADFHAKLGAVLEHYRDNGTGPDHAQWLKEKYAQVKLLGAEYWRVDVCGADLRFRVNYFQDKDAFWVRAVPLTPLAMFYAVRSRTFQFLTGRT